LPTFPNLGIQMPYFSIEDLPDSVRHNLPQKAQEIYRKAFNKVWDSHRDPATLPSGQTRVELAAKIAWAAVKEKYVKIKRMWRPIDSKSAKKYKLRLKKSKK
jgi:cation transport regulator